MPAPSLDLTKIVIGGPCKVTDGATVFYTEGDARLEAQPVWRNIPAALAGEEDSVLVDLTWKLTFVPKSYYNYNPVLIPATAPNYNYVNWTVSGGRIFGTVPGNRQVTLLGSDGQQYQFTRAILTRMPDVYLGLGRSMWGPVEYTAFIGYQNALADATAFWTSSSGNSWSQADYAAISAAHQESLFTGAWGAVAGFTSVFAEEGFQITHEFRTEPVKQGNVTVDMKILTYRAMVAFKPQQPSEANLLAASQFGAGSGLGIGTRLTSGALANAHDFVMTDGNVTVTAKSVALNRGQFFFDNRLNRLGEWGLITALTTPGSRLIFA